MPPPKSHDSKTARGGAQPSDLRVGSVLAGRYRIDGLLGEGGMGKVYAAEHVLMRKKLAVKVLHRELTDVPDVVRRFEREAMAAANVDHPNVAAATDFGKLPDGSVFLVLEFVQGRNLRDEIARGPMTVERGLLIGRQIGSALAAAHALDIVHRDLKPENVMLIEKGNDPDFAKVLDFGIAKVPMGDQDDKHAKPITKVGTVFGTPEYMSPEQALGQKVDGRADVYSLGVIIYEMIAGVRPFSSKAAGGILGQQLSKPPPAVVGRCPGLFVPPAVDHLLQKLLARDVGERFQSASAAVSAIEALLGPMPGSGPRLFTMAAGSPPSSPDNPRMESIPDLEAPVPVLVPPDVAARIQPGPGVVTAPSGSDPAMSSSPAIDIRQSVESFLGAPSQPDPYEVALDGAPPRSVLVPHEGARFRAALDDMVGRGKSFLDETYDWIDDRRARLPPKLRDPLTKIPAPALLVGGLFMLIGLVLGIVLVTGALAGGKGDKGRSPAGAPSASVPVPSGPGTETSPVARASDADLGAAEAGGRTSLEELFGSYPRDSRVGLALLKAQMKDNEHVAAVSTVEKVLEANPALNDNPEIASALWTTVQVKESSDATYKLLAGPMGARGADLVYDLTTTPGVRKDLKLRAEKWLQSDALQQHSSPALNVLIALKKATTCRQRYALLERAQDVGDERALAVLETYQKKTGCGRRGTDDCNDCMRGDDVLAQAIERIKERSKK